MPGFLGGGGSGSSGTGGEIRFPKEFIDPVTKLRISQPENLIDTDFEYGLQPTKWETVELINNTPSFFSKSGDTTIPGIISIATNTGTREITVVTATDHGLAVGIPINVTGTKSVTADGSYIINSIPNLTTFTYLCKDIQQGNNAIEDLYTSIITGEFFQGSQIRISDAEGIITDGEATSTLTVKTDSTHGFGLNTPFYFLNLNSTISQEFEASNTAAKSFDSSNSATAQTFDGSNSLSTFNIDWSNSATVGGTTSTISNVSTVNDTITATHGAETFANQRLGTPLYYNLSVPASSGYFFNNPRGVVFLKTIDALNNPVGTSVFQVSATPDGDAIDIVSSMSGTIQLANQARTFAGNNVNASTEILLTIIEDAEIAADLSNDGSVFVGTPWRVAQQTSYSGSLVNVTSTNPNGTSLDYYTGAMVLYSTTGSAATGLTNNTTYFVDSFFSTGGSNYAMTLKPLPTSSALTSISGGTGTQSFTRIGLSVDRDIIHLRNSNYAVGDMLRYTYSVGARFTVSDAADVKDFYIVETAYDAHNYKIAAKLGISATGGTTTEAGGYRYHAFTTVGTSTFSVTGDGFVEVLVVAGGGGGGGSYGSGGGGGAGGLVYHSAKAVTSGNYSVVVGAGGAGGTTHDGTYANSNSPNNGKRGGNSSFGDIVAQGGGGGNMSFYVASDQVSGGSGGGGGDYYYGVNNPGASRGGVATQGNSGGGLGYGNPGGSRGPGGPTSAEDNSHTSPHEGAGGGGAGGTATNGGTSTASHGGVGRQYSQFSSWGSPAGWFAGGGGGGYYNERGEAATNPPGTGGAFGGGGRGARAYNRVQATVGVPNTGGGGGGGSQNNNQNNVSNAVDQTSAPIGGSGIVLVRYLV
jgi:hypothetical protein